MTLRYQTPLYQNQSDGAWNKYGLFSFDDLCFAKYLDHVRTLDKSYQNHLVISENLSRIYRVLRRVYEFGYPLSSTDISDIIQLTNAMTEEGIIDILYTDLNPTTVKYIKNLVYGKLQNN